ncbi:hypothetical protein F1536_23080 [Achromobacter xylosoxidans]|uniref:hypothetical protein n=1 Tax=Alcaligenes xylosoxydans xylosoxydans TaxID=85698 RepID=UPI001232A5C9|nr:hypothetical protein [Achromobacter xylosoxidans]KAA5921330.1 hypothetical protein F1536_23080 [Achromobacter xylosoxidans]
MNSPIKLPPLPYPQIPGNDYTAADMRAYAEYAVRDARNAAIEDVACMICRRFDLNIPADLGPKLVNAIRSMKQEDGHG